MLALRARRVPRTPSPVPPRRRLAAIASGDADPLAGGGALVQLLGQRYRDAGLADVTVTLYRAARHEILNETNRGEVTADIIAWLRIHAA